MLLAILASGSTGACSGGDEIAGEAPPPRNDRSKGGSAGSSAIEDIPRGGASGASDGGASGAGGLATGSGGSSTSAGGASTSSGGSTAFAAGSAGAGGITTSAGGASAMTCVAVAEVCDGVVDDDCDGVVDNGCACVNGSTVPCQAACGAGLQTCQAGALGACNGPGVDPTGQCPCPAGSFRGTSGACYTSGTCTVVVDGGVLKVSAGKTASETLSCPSGLYAAEARYGGTSVPCSWKSTSTSATLTCTNPGGSAVDADGLRLTCSCQKPNGVSYVCQTCNCSNCN